jgi:putative chitinase
MDVGTFQRATGCSKLLADRWHAPITEAMAEFRIETPQQIAAFLANVGHESGGFQYTREIWGPTPQQKRYERDFNAPWPKSAEEAKRPEFEVNRLAFSLGNSEKGDGYTYRGGGLIQTTGRENHRLTGIALKLDLIARPDLLALPANAARSAGWFWQSHDLNELADAGKFELIVRRINGGLKGYPDRVDRWLRAGRILS